jgi:hypothetical protein
MDRRGGASGRSGRHRAPGRTPATLWALVLGTVSLALAATGGTAGATSASLSATVKGSATGRQGTVMVRYLATGRVTGTLRGVEGRHKVQLLAQPFPFTGRFRQQAAEMTRPGGAYSFKVRPRAATRYRVRLAASHATLSPPVSLYVVSRPTGFHYSSSQSCSAPAPTTCQVTVQETIVLPPAVARSEVAKHRYVYVGVALAHSRTASPPPPKALRLDRRATLSVAPRPTAGRYATAVVLRYRVDSSYRQSGWHAGWAVEWCSKETFARDGFGLPFHYGCGRPSVPNSPVDLHSLG